MRSVREEETLENHEKVGVFFEKGMSGTSSETSKTTSQRENVKKLSRADIPKHQKTFRLNYDL